MKIANILTVLALAAAAARAGDGNPPGARTMTAYLIDRRLDSNHPVQFAQQAASRMYASLGLDLRWRYGRPRVVDPHDLVFVIELVDRTPAEKRRGALAFALPYEGVSIQVFYDRVVNLEPVSSDMLMAHVFVHEIAHLLQGTEHHSPTGVMKAQYTADDARRMRTRPLPFTAEDVTLIQLGVAARLRQPALASASALARPPQPAAAR